MNPILVRSTPGGERRHDPLDIVDALVKEWDFDAHTVQYEGERRRNKEDVSPENPLVLTCELYDFDRKDAPDVGAWAEDCLSRLPEGFIGYRTAGGFRAVTLRETPFLVKDAETWEDWRAHHGGRAEALGALLGADPDHATDEPNRLFRLPNAKRDDGKPSFPGIYGELGFSSLAPAPYERRKATEVVVGGDARKTKVGAAFAAAGLVQGMQGQKLVVTCPWVHEHSGKNASGTFVDEDAEQPGLGAFHCMHQHCIAAKRHSSDALEELGKRAAVAIELAMWPEPANVLRPYRRLDAPPEPKRELSRFLSGKDLLVVDDEVQWLCHPLQLCPGRPPMMFGDSSAGKTSSAIAIALAVAAGLPIFGEFACQRGPVLHVSLDSGLRSVKKRYREFARGMGLDLEKLDITVFPHRLKLVNEYGKFLRDGFAEIDNEVQRGGYKLIILDSLAALCVGMDENSTDIGGPVRATTDNRAVWMWLHHTGKSGETIRGSSAIKAACGAVWKGEKVAEEIVSWQMEKPCEEFCGEKLPRQFRTRWHHAPGEQRLTVEPDEDRPSNTPMKIQDEILRHLRSHGPTSLKVMEASITGKAATIRECAKELAQRGILTYDGKRYHVVADVLAVGGSPG